MVKCLFWDECLNAGTEKCDGCVKVIKRRMLEGGGWEFVIHYTHLRHTKKAMNHG